VAGTTAGRALEADTLVSLRSGVGANQSHGEAHREPRQDGPERAITGAAETETWRKQGGEDRTHMCSKILHERLPDQDHTALREIPWVSFNAHTLTWS